MEQIMNYVKPELVVVAVVLYFVGIGLKNTEKMELHEKHSHNFSILSSMESMLEAFLKLH